MGNIVDTLHDGGHNVTMMLVMNDHDVQGTGSLKNVKTIRYESPLVGKEEWSQLHYKQSNIFYSRSFEMSDYLKMEDINYRICQSLLDNPSLLKSLNSTKFDIMVVELFHFCPAGVANILKIPKIILASALGMTTTHYELTDLSITLSNTPVFMTGHSNSMAFYERLFNILYYFVEKWLLARMQKAEQRLFNSRFENFPDLFKLLQEKTDFILLNVNELTDPVRPITGNIKYIGGANIRNLKILPPDLEEIVESSQKGVILFSFGSLIHTTDMPTHIRKSFIYAFREFPQYTFLWKDDISSNSTLPNAHFRSWLPQVDLLAHPRVKAFITHGGMNSIHESLLFGVPMVILPIFADQVS